MDTAASGGWEKSCLAGEHMLFKNLCLNNFIKTVNFLRNFCWLDENSGCLDTA
jgi:hypothetical protein